MLDLRIDNATIYDGCGAAPLSASVGIKDGRICELGQFETQAQSRVDAHGLALMPGIIDTHTHSMPRLPGTRLPTRPRRWA